MVYKPSNISYSVLIILVSEVPYSDYLPVAGAL